MKEHWDAFCTLGLVHFAAFPDCAGGDGPILETLQRIVEDDFFNAVEVTRINDDNIRKQAAKQIHGAHLQVAFGAQPIILRGKLNLNSLDTVEVAQAIQTLAGFIDQAAEIGAERFVLLSGPNPAEQDHASATTALVEALGTLCNKAKSSGVNIVLETFDREIEKMALIGPAGEAAAVARLVRAAFPQFGLLYDMGHMPLLDETPMPALETIKSYLVHAHVGNCVKVKGMVSYGDQHPRFGFPGGENDVPQLVEFIRALFQVGYLSRESREGELPWVGFEIRPQDGETSGMIIANLKRTWREAWMRV